MTSIVSSFSNIFCVRCIISQEPSWLSKSFCKFKSSVHWKAENNNTSNIRDHHNWITAHLTSSIFSVVVIDDHINVAIAVAVAATGYQASFCYLWFWFWLFYSHTRAHITTRTCDSTHIYLFIKCWWPVAIATENYCASRYRTCWSSR